ncbi:MAG: BrnA antitoxin family protein [Rubrivivax sp.]
MTGSPKKTMTRKQVLEAVKAPPPGGDFVWDGADEDDRPATPTEVNAALETARRKRGRPAGSATKEQVALRVDHDVLAAFRAGGPGWQTRVNNALRDWLRTHPSG